MPNNLVALLVLLALLPAGLTRAQAPAPVPRWNMANLASVHTEHNMFYSLATAVDEAGNVFTAGMFYDTVAFGPHRLSSAGGNDFYLAKYVPATHTWAWAVRGGGLQSDHAYGLAVQGGCVYVTGYLQNNYLDDNGVTLDSTAPVPVPGAVNDKPSSDMFVAKYFDCGTHALLGWCQVAGGSGMDYATSVAVSGRSVYITGTSENTSHHRQGVVFGGSGPLPGLWPQAGTSHMLSNSLVLAKYTDYGFSAAFNWSQVAGGRQGGVGRAVAAHAGRVYVAGDLINNRTDTNRVQLGGHGRVPGTARQLGVSSYPVQHWMLAKYFDLGDHAAFGWSQVAGGKWGGMAQGVAVSDSSVYVTGIIHNDRSDSMRVRFGGSGLVAGTYPAPGLDRRVGYAVGLAKYTDHGATGTFEWLRTDGRSDWYEGTSLVARGRWVYVLARSFFNRTSTRQGIRGGVRWQPGSWWSRRQRYWVEDVPYIAGYYDEGPRGARRWVRIFDYRAWLQFHHLYLALSGTRLYVLGNTTLPARYGRLMLAPRGVTFGFVVAGLDLGPTLAATAKNEAANLGAVSSP